MSKSSYCIEVEIKISKGDFKADFNKWKHGLLAASLKKQKYFVKNCGQSYFTESKHINGKWEYERTDFSKIKILSLDEVPMPNKFWYAVPEGLISENEVPKYAGLIYAIDRGETTTPYFRIVKRAPFIHKRLLNIEKLLFDKYVWDRARLINENYSLQRALKKLTELKEPQITRT